MRQVFYPYEMWEDYKNGMYSRFAISDEHVSKSKILLQDPIAFYNACVLLLSCWPIASAVNMTNKDQNRRAWLGAAACSYMYKCTEKSVRQAWHLLTEEEQKAANSVADRVIYQYEQSNIENHAKTLFD